MIRPFQKQHESLGFAEKKNGKKSDFSSKLTVRIRTLWSIRIDDKMQNKCN